MTIQPEAEQLTSVARLTRDMAKASVGMTIPEIRYLVDAYYQIQEHRIAMAAQQRTLRESGEPSSLFVWLAEQQETIENQVKRALDKWTDEDPLSAWAKTILGIGPVISAGLRAHIDLTRVNSAGQIWSFAGLNPTVEWKKGEKRPYNADLKTLCAFKIGESFVKVSGNEKSLYGRLYKTRKAEYIARNQAGDFKPNAEAKLAKYNIGKTTDAYKAYSIGMLPPAHIHAMARRYAVKLFLSHYFEAGLTIAGREFPKPYVIEHCGHKDYISYTEAS